MMTENCIIVAFTIILNSVITDLGNNTATEKLDVIINQFRFDGKICLSAETEMTKQ